MNLQLLLRPDKGHDSRVRHGSKGMCLTINLPKISPILRLNHFPDPPKPLPESGRNDHKH